MAASTRSKLFIPNPPKSAHQFFREAKEQLLEENYLLLTDVPKDFALPLIEGLDSDPAIGSEGKYRYGISQSEQLLPMLTMSCRYNYENGKLLAFMPTELHDSLQFAINDIIKDMVINNFISQNQWLRLTVTAGTSKFPPCLLL